MNESSMANNVYMRNKCARYKQLNDHELTRDTVFT